MKYNINIGKPHRRSASSHMGQFDHDCCSMFFPVSGNRAGV